LMLFCITLSIHQHCLNLCIYFFSKSYQFFLTHNTVKLSNEELILNTFRSSNEILYASLISPTQATCSTHLILPHLIILIIFKEQFKLMSSS
jgi:hypothetical protein